MIQRSVIVSDIFYTLQGEARWTGTPAVFIRLQGCDVGCPWCDTKHTWPLIPSHAFTVATVGQLEAKHAELIDREGELMPVHAYVTINDLLNYVIGEWPEVKHVVITGGEPALQPDMPHLVEALLRAGYFVQIETSGTYELTTVPAMAWVTVSPKWDMPGGRRVLRSAMDRANEIKVPIGKQKDIERMLPRILTCDIDPSDVWLQPLSQNTKATKVCVDACLKYGFKLSLQTHKYAGIP